jgi:hypothetical protein
MSALILKEIALNLFEFYFVSSTVQQSYVFVESSIRFWKRTFLQKLYSKKICNANREEK